MVVEKKAKPATANWRRPGTDNREGRPKGGRNGRNGNAEGLSQEPSVGPRVASGNGHTLQELDLHGSYLKGLFGQVLMAGIIGLLLGLAAATVFVQRVFPNLAAYPVQMGLLVGFVTLAAVLLRQAQGNTVRLWRRTWQTFELRLAEAHELASRDDLTQLYNRRIFYETLQQEMEKARSFRTPLAIVMMDMDDLKAINDEYGHQVGDTVLIHIAATINEMTRAQDVTARLGGDEFAIIMPSTNHREAEEMATRLWEKLQNTPLVLDDGTSISLGVSLGVAGFPWSGESMQSIIHSADAALYANKLVRKGTGEEALAQERRRVSAVAVDVLSSALDIRDKMTHRHSRRVARLAAAVARQLDLSEDEVQTIEQAAALHDIGKIGVPDSVLWKPTPLDDQEWSDMRRHCELGYYILKGIDIFADTAEIVYAHHEHYDGKGYPRGLQGKEIPLGARVFAVVDSYDAMTSRRPYRGAKPRQKALGEIRQHAGSQFDPDVVTAFLQAIERASPAAIAEA